MRTKPIIVIEGCDGAGKETQSLILANKIGGEKISFPQYESLSSGPVKMFIQGDLGPIDSLTPMQAAELYAVDRAISFRDQKNGWGRFVGKKPIVFDRYVTSNFTHQAGRLPKEERLDFIADIENLEYVKWGLPRANLVVFLDVPPDVSIALMKKREQEIPGDIFEENEKYLRKSYENAKEIAEKKGWVIIECVDGDRLKTIEEISEMVFAEYQKYIEKED